MVGCRFVKTSELDCSLEDRRNMSGQLSMNVGRWVGNGPRYVRALHTLHASMPGSIASYVLQISGVVLQVSLDVQHAARGMPRPRS